MKKALTIGELLVTMTIIGAIAAMTLPGFLADYHKKVYAAKIKKVYGMVETAIVQASLEEKFTSLWDSQYFGSQTKNQNFLNTYFKKSSNTTSNIFATTYKNLDGSTRNLNLNDTSKYGLAKLVSGEAIAFHCMAPSGPYDDVCVMYVDTNSNAGPNIEGRDLFIISVDGPSISGAWHLYTLKEDNWEMKY